MYIACLAFCLIGAADGQSSRKGCSCRNKQSCLECTGKGWYAVFSVLCC